MNLVLSLQGQKYHQTHKNGALKGLGAAVHAGPSLMDSNKPPLLNSRMGRGNAVICEVWLPQHPSPGHLAVLSVLVWSRESVHGRLTGEHGAQRNPLHTYPTCLKIPHSTVALEGPLKM